MVIQSNEKDCGKACVRQMLYLVYHKRCYMDADLMYECENFRQIRDQLQNYGIAFKSYQVDSLDTIEKRNLPCIAQIQIEDKLHFVIISKVYKNEVKIYDPEFGEMNLDKEEFEQEFTRNVLLYESKNETIKLKGTRVLTYKEYLLYFLSYLITTIPLMMLVLLKVNNSNFIFDIICFSASLIGVMMLNALNSFLQTNLSNKIILPYMDAYRNKDDLEKLTKIVTLSIKDVSTMVSYLSLITLMLSFLITTTSAFSFLLIIICVFAFVKQLLKKEKNTVSRKCSLYEKKYLDSLNKERIVKDEYYSQAKKQASKYLFLNLVTYLFEILCIGVFAISISNLQGFFDLNIMIYMILMGVSFSFTLDKLLPTLQVNEQKISLLNSLSHNLQTFLVDYKLAQIN